MDCYKLGSLKHIHGFSFCFKNTIETSNQLQNQVSENSLRIQQVCKESLSCVESVEKKNQLSIISTYITGSSQYILHISTSNSIYFEICQLCIFIYVPTYLLFWVVNGGSVYFKRLSGWAVKIFHRLKYTDHI